MKDWSLRRAQLGVVAALLVVGGCETVVRDSDAASGLEVLATACRPTYEVLTNTPTARGVAERRYSFWGLVSKGPSSFSLGEGEASWLNSEPMRAAACWDACEKAGASVLLSPHYSVENGASCLGFSGWERVSVEGVPARLVGVANVQDAKSAEACREL